jgi:uncharacterized protein YukE
MTGSVLGMDVDAVEQLARAVQQTADTIDQTARQLTSQLNSATWIGSDGQRFRDEWQGTDLPGLTSIVNRLRDDATRLTAEAQSQRDASAS